MKASVVSLSDDCAKCKLSIRYRATIIQGDRRRLTKCVSGACTTNCSATGIAPQATAAAEQFIRMESSPSIQHQPQMGIPQSPAAGPGISGKEDASW